MKIGAKIALFIAVASALGVISCKKDYPSRYCDTPSQVVCEVDTSIVNVRVINKTGYPLCNFRVKYQTNTTDTLRYGTLDVEEISCYTKLTDTKVFPRLFCDLGTGHFKIPDSLTQNGFIYNGLIEDNPGFYTFYVFLGGPLDSNYLSPAMVSDSL